MPPYFDDTEAKKAGPPRHTEEQLKLLRCAHEVAVPRRWWREQEAAAADAEAHPLVPAYQQRLRRLVLPCVDCGVQIIARFSTRPTFAQRVRLVSDESALAGEREEAVGQVIDERDLPPEEPTGVIDEADEIELPARSRRK